MYDVLETELRALQKIEESVLLIVSKTHRSCPRHLLYLKTGMYLARYQVHRQMLNFLQYVFTAAKKNPLSWHA